MTDETVHSEGVYYEEKKGRGCRFEGQAGQDEAYCFRLLAKDAV